MSFTSIVKIGALILLVATPYSTACTRTEPGTREVSTGTVVQGQVGQRVDHFLSQHASSGFNGCVLITVDAHIILHKGYGWADKQHKIQVSTSTPFWIASISKQFAAAAILRLVEQGRLSLDDKLQRFFPALPLEKEGITLHQLLTHTAGLEQHYAADGITDRDEAVRAILAHPLVSPPGEGFSYSNDAYNLIAAVVEITAEQPYEDFLREELLKPVDLRHTGFWGPENHPEVAAILQADWADSTNLLPNWGYRGGVGMFSTPEDLYKWYQALQSGTVLSDTSRDRLFTTYVKRKTTGVGYGWFTSSGPGGKVSIWTRGYESFGHGAVLLTYPAERVIIIVTSNSGELTENVPMSHQLAEELSELVLKP